MNIKFILFWPVIFMCLFVYSHEAWAAKANLKWDANTEEDLAGYKVYWDVKPRVNNSGTYSNSKDVGDETSLTVENIADTGTTYFAVTAYDTSNNESEFSAETKKTPGDIIKDGSVNMLDVQGMINNYNKSECNNIADINLDCVVNMLDVGAMIANYGISGQ